MAVTSGTRLRVPRDVFAREFDGETVIVDLVRGDYFGLDAIGGLAWRGFAAGNTPAEVAEQVHAEYDVSVPDALRDVVELADSLVRRGLLEEVEEGGR